VPLVHLNYIVHYRPHLCGCYYFTSHKKISYFAYLDWLNRKKLGSTLFLLYSHKGWTAALVCCLLSTTSMYSTVNCTSAISYNYDATKCIASDTTTLNISCSTIPGVPNLGTCISGVPFLSEGVHIWLATEGKMYLYIIVFLRKMLGTQYGPVGLQFLWF